MPDPSRRIILEKSRTVRRRYQRSNKRFQFTASQIERIEREQERENRAKQLREKEKKRIANKKKRIEKETKEREERRRLGLPEPHALPLPSSQPLLFNFIKKPATTPLLQENEGEDREPGSPGSISTEGDDSSLSVFDDVSDSQMAAVDSKISDHNGSTGYNNIDDSHGKETDDEDEFSECSIFDDEDIIKEVETITTAQGTLGGQQETNQPTKNVVSVVASVVESFQDDTAALLEEFGHELDIFDIDEEFEQQLIQLDAV